MQTTFSSGFSGGGEPEQLGDYFHRAKASGGIAAILTYRIERKDAPAEQSTKALDGHIPGLVDEVAWIASALSDPTVRKVAIMFADARSDSPKARAQAVDGAARPPRGADALNAASAAAVTLTRSGTGSTDVADFIDTVADALNPEPPAYARKASWAVLTFSR